jgi:hypothetical protein
MTPYPTDFYLVHFFARGAINAWLDSGDGPIDTLAEVIQRIRAEFSGYANPFNASHVKVWRFSDAPARDVTEDVIAEIWAQMEEEQ